MKIIHTREHGARNIAEFVYGGVVLREPAADAGDAEWADYLFIRENKAAPCWELWLHSPSGMWYAVLRDAGSDEFLRVVLAREFFAGGVLTDDDAGLSSSSSSSQESTPSQS